MLVGVTCRGYKTSYHDGHVQVHEDKVKAVDAAPCLDHVECLLPVLDSGYAGLTAALQNAEGHLIAGLGGREEVWLVPTRGIWPLRFRMPRATWVK